MTNYTTKKADQYGRVLLKDGIETICPFRPAVPIPVQNALGQTTIQLISTPCSTVCPHADYHNLSNLGQVYTISCNGSPIEFDVEEQLETKLIN
jgi:hypothetical protein